MRVIAYTRISTDQQDLEKQKHLLLEYAQQMGWLIEEFIEVAVSAKKSFKCRKIDKLSKKLTKGDVLLAAAKAKGVKLGRPKGSKNKKGRVLDTHKKAIRKYLELGVNVSDISKIINDQLEQPLTYNAFKYFIKNDKELALLADKSSSKSLTEKDKALRLK